MLHTFWSYELSVPLWTFIGILVSRQQAWEHRVQQRKVWPAILHRLQSLGIIAHRAMSSGHHCFCWLSL